MLKQIIYKLFIKGKFLPLCLVICFTAGLTVINNISRACPSDEKSLMLYKEFVGKYAGEYTAEKEKSLEKTDAEKQEVENRINTLNNKYANGCISLETYTAEREELNRLTEGNDGYLLFLNRVSEAKDGNGIIVDNIAWNALFSTGTTELLCVAVVIFAVITVALKELETPLIILTTATKNGKRKIYPLISFMIFFTLFSTGIIVSAVKFLVAQIYYGISCYNLPMNSIGIFSGCKTDISLLTGYILISLIFSFGLAFLGGFTLFVGCLLKNTLYTAGTVSMSVVVPMLFEKSAFQRKIPMPYNIIYSVGLFSGINNGENIIFINTITVVSVLVFSAIICLLFYIIYCLLMRRSVIV